MTKPAPAHPRWRRILRENRITLILLVATAAVIGLIVCLVIVGPPGARPDARRGAAVGTPTASSPLGLPALAWWGGPSYYSAFPKAVAAGWTKDSFFPIAVFYGKPADAPQLASLGINTYMGAEHDGSPISMITDTGISVIAQSEWTEAELGSDPRVVGWHISDECDQGEGPCGSTDDEYRRLALQRGFADAARSHHDGRFVQANFGNGVLGTYWATHTMAQQVALVDVSSVDKYAYTSPSVDRTITGSPEWPAHADPDRAATYGWLQDRMESYMRPAASKPNWVFVETSEPFLDEPGARVITTDRIAGAVWSSLIQGSAGIAYFQHNNSGCGTYSLVQCSAALHAAVKALDAQVRSLAPVLNTRSYRWSFGSGLDTALKAHDGSAYILAMATGTPGSRTFTLPSTVKGSTVEVVGENRSIPVEDGRFTDTFAAEYSHHVYRIALGG